MTIESAPSGQQGLNAGVLAMSAGLGFSLAALSASAIASLTPAAQLSWGWRVPFLAGLPMGVLVYCLQMAAEESPEFMRSQAAEGNAETGEVEVVVDLFTHAESEGTEGTSSLAALEQGKAGAAPAPAPTPTPTASTRGPTSPTPFVAVISSYRVEIPLLCVITAAMAVASYTLSTWIPLYASTLAPAELRSGGSHSNFAFENARAITGVILFGKAVVLCPLSGMMVDRFGSHALLIFGLCWLGIASPLALWMFDAGASVGEGEAAGGVGVGGYSTSVGVGSAAQLIGAQCLMAVGQAAVIPSLVVCLSSTFKEPRLRYTAVSLAYNTPIAVFGGTLNLVETELYQAMGRAAAVGVYPLLMCTFAILCVMRLPKSRKAEGEGEREVEGEREGRQEHNRGRYERSSISPVITVVNPMELQPTQDP